MTETIVADPRALSAATVVVAAAGFVRSRANRLLRKAFGIGAAALGTLADKGFKPCFSDLLARVFNSIGNYNNTTKLILEHGFGDALALAHFLGHVPVVAI